MSNNTILPLTNEAHRAMVIHKAAEKYIKTGITNNITDALRRYLDSDAGPDEQIPIFITSPLLQAIRSALRSARPTCDECRTGINLQNGATDQAGRKWLTAWICPKCHRIEYSNQSLSEWLEILKSEIRRGAVQP